MDFSVVVYLAGNIFLTSRVEVCLVSDHERPEEEHVCYLKAICMQHHYNVGKQRLLLADIHKQYFLSPHYARLDENIISPEPTGKGTYCFGADPVGITLSSLHYIL